MCVGVLPFTHVVASADDDILTGEFEPSQTVTNFKVSCGGYANGGGGFVQFHEPVDVFTNNRTGKTSEMGVHATYPKIVHAGEEFTYSLQFDSIDLVKELFSNDTDAAGDLLEAERIKIDLDIPRGAELISAGVRENTLGDTPSSDAVQPEEIIGITGRGFEPEPTGPQAQYLRIAVNNATEQRNIDGVISDNGTNASGHDDGGFRSSTRSVVFPVVDVTMKAPDSVGTTISPGIRVTNSADVYDDPANFFTFLTKNSGPNPAFFPHSGFHSIRCSPRDAPTSGLNKGAEPLAEITVADTPVFGLDDRVLGIADIPGSSTPHIQMKDFVSGTDSQQWVYTSAHEIRNPFNNECIDVVEDGFDSGGQRNGSQVVLSPCGGNPGQKWTLDSAVTEPGNPGGAIINQADGKCMDVTDNQSADGVQVQIWDCTGAFNQQWNFPPLQAS